MLHPFGACVSNRHYSPPPLWLSRGSSKEIRQGIQEAHFNANSHLPCPAGKRQDSLVFSKKFCHWEWKQGMEPDDAGEGTLAFQVRGEVGFLE